MGHPYQSRAARGKMEPAAGFVDTEKRCLMKLEVVHGKASVSARVQG